MPNLESQLISILRASPNLMMVLEACHRQRLNDWRLVSGAIYGTVFNHLTGRDPDYGIKDYDIAYFDPDTSYEAEDIIIKQMAAAMPEHLHGKEEVRNQARVHLWFNAKFGGEFAPLDNTDESLSRYLCFAHMVAVRLEDDGEITIAAPFGLEDIFKMQMRHNPARGAYDNFMAKCQSIKERWPEVVIID